MSDQGSDATGKDGLRKFYRHALEAFSVLASLGFLIAVTLNEVLFRQWGLSFIQLATPADVLMAGLNALFYVSPLILSAVLGIVIGLFTRRLRWLWWVAVLVACCVAGALALSVGMGKGLGSGVRALTVLWIGPLTLFLTHPRFRPQTTPRRTLIVIGLMATAGVASMVTDLVITQSRIGVSPTPLSLQTPPRAGCRAHVLWHGERVTLVECGDRGGDEPWVIVNESGMAMRADRAG